MARERIAFMGLRLARIRQLRNVPGAAILSLLTGRAGQGVRPFVLSLVPRLRPALIGTALAHMARSQGALVVAVAGFAHGGLIARGRPLGLRLGLVPRR